MSSKAAHFTGLVAADDPRWLDVLPALEHDFYHLPAYAELCARRDGGRAVAFIQRDDKATLLFPLILLPVSGFANDYCHATCPYGYPGITISHGAGSEFVLSALQEALVCLKQAGVVSVFSRLHPLIELPFSALEQHGMLVLHGETVSLDLSSAPAISWSAMRESHRRHIQAAQRAGYVSTVGWEALDGYLACYEETMRRVGAHEQYLFDRSYVESLREALGGRLHLCTVSIGGQVACGGLFSELGGVMQYHLGGTRDAHLRDSPMKLMFDFMRNWGHVRGNRVLHLGGGVGGQKDALFHFKAGFSQRRHPFRTYRMIVDEVMYQRLCRESGVSTDRGGFFPPFGRSTSGSERPPR